MTTAVSAVLRGGATQGWPPPRSVVLLLHGGREHSVEVTTARQLAVLRMQDMYVGLRHARTRAAIYSLRFRLRGWNAGQGAVGEASPVVDVRRALDEIDAHQPGLPVVLLGHSMGARAGFAVADDERVRGVCGLAPWLPDGEPVRLHGREQRFVIAHGTADRVTSPAGSLRFAERLRDADASVARFEMPGERHALLARPLLWHRFAVRVSLALAGELAMPAALSGAFGDHAADSLRLRLDGSSYR